MRRFIAALTKPPQEILDILNAPATPSLLVNPSRTWATLSEITRYPTITEVSVTMLRLAGIRIDPRTNGLHLAPDYVAIKLVKVPEGTQTPLALPQVIDTAANMGVIDPDRVGVGGHSYGTFMTANLLAHTRLFRAGIAESGAYNPTLTPFGFQSERRTFWEAKETYLNMSPFYFANKIKDPVLLIHVEADDNSGTCPVQSDRMYQALRGNWATVRLVFLLDEAHGCRAKGTIEHVLWEKIRWFDKYVKDAPKQSTSLQ